MKALTALTLGKGVLGGSPVAPRPAPVAREPQSDVLFEMFNGALGSVHLARLLKGPDAGRLVTLRKLPFVQPPELAAAADIARSVAHPKLAKVLGIVEEHNARYLASEHISGVTLFELGRAASNRQLPVLPSVAVRIVIDALGAAQAAQALLTETLHSSVVRCVHPECLWIAEFGETFLAEVLVAPLLGRKITDGPEPTEAAVLTADVRSAALELVRMGCAGLSSDNPLDTDLSRLPPELEQALLPALGHGSLVGYTSPKEFRDALAALDESLIATETQVAEELRRLMGTVLSVRRQKLAMLERVASVEAAEEQSDETKFFRLAVKTEQRVTTRPPPVSAPQPAAPTAFVDFAPSQPVLKPDESDEPDEPTRLLLREEDGRMHSEPLGQAAAMSEAESETPLPAGLFESAVRKRQSMAARLVQQSPAAVPAPAVPTRRLISVVLAVCAGLVLVTGLRLGWLMHRDHASLGGAWHEQARALGLGGG